MDRSSHHPRIDAPHEASVAGKQRGSRRRRLLLVLLVTFGVAGIVASPAWAQPKALPTIACSSPTEVSVTWTFSGFPNAPNNTITETVKVDGVLANKTKFVFNGPSATNTLKIKVSPGAHTIKVHAGWITNGVKGETDRKVVAFECEKIEPKFTIEKKQTIFGSGKPFTKAPLEGNVGETVDYEIIVKDTGNTALKFSPLSDSG